MNYLKLDVLQPTIYPPTSLVSKRKTLRSDKPIHGSGC